MKAKPALPERVRSMEGLGVAVRRTRGSGAIQGNAQEVTRLEGELSMMLSEEFEQWIQLGLELLG